MPFKDVMDDRRGYLPNLSNYKRETWKQINGIRTQDLCYTSGTL